MKSCGWCKTEISEGIFCSEKCEKQNFKYLMEYKNREPDPFEKTCKFSGCKSPFLTYDPDKEYCQEICCTSDGYLKNIPKDYLQEPKKKREYISCLHCKKRKAKDISVDERFCSRSCKKEYQKERFTKKKVVIVKTKEQDPLYSEKDLNTANDIEKIMLERWNKRHKKVAGKWAQ